jgi:hypothetical protein
MEEGRRGEEEQRLKGGGARGEKSFRGEGGWVLLRTLISETLHSIFCEYTTSK